jgi:hypothetical protein
MSSPQDTVSIDWHRLAERLRQERDLWMHRSNEHAMEADNFREQVITLRAYVEKLKEALDERP